MPTGRLDCKTWKQQSQKEAWTNWEEGCWHRLRQLREIAKKRLAVELDPRERKIPEDLVQNGPMDQDRNRGGMAASSVGVVKRGLEKWGMVWMVKAKW